MTHFAWGPLIILFVILALATLAAQFKWLPENSWIQRILFFLSGAAISFLLYGMGVPPKWLDGSKGAFALAATLLIGAFIGTNAGRSFRLPLLLGMGGTLLVVNVMRHL